MDKIRAEGEKIYGLHMRYQTQMISFSEQLSDIDTSINQNEQICYRNKNDLCLSHYDNYLLANLEVTRKMDMVMLDKETQCWNTLPYSLRPEGEFEWNIKSQETLDAFKKFYECTKPLNEKLLQLYHEKFTLRNNIMRTLTELNKKVGK
jgi:hypothetical protein